MPSTMQASGLFKLDGNNQKLFGIHDSSGCWGTRHLSIWHIFSSCTGLLLKKVENNLFCLVSTLYRPQCYVSVNSNCLHFPSNPPKNVFDRLSPSVPPRQVFLHIPWFLAKYELLNFSFYPISYLVFLTIFFDTELFS